MLHRSIALEAMAVAVVLRALPAVAGGPAYAPEDLPQFRTPAHPDRIPDDAEARRIWARALAYDAALYGALPVIQYREMYAQAIDRADPGYTGFNRFAHGRSLAGPDYKAFKTPNADTLYSNAWLDLSHGPLLFDVPEAGNRYFTASFVDAFGNASNISTRTRGGHAGRYLIAPLGWQGSVPAGAELFRVATPYMWILLRVLVDGETDVAAANRLQDGFRLAPVGPAAPAVPDYPDGRATDALGFFRILDFVLRSNGHPAGEEALVRRYRGIGIDGGRERDFATATADPVIRDALAAGHADATTVIGRTVNQTGWPVGSWRSGVDAGRYGFNYVYRAASGTLGAGANVSDENYAFTTFRDANGAALDGARHRYRLVLDPPPPARFFWSVTVYDAKTRALHPNPIRRYLIGDRTPGLARGADGRVEILLQAKPPQGAAARNWLPVPDGPFYLALRAQGPEPAMKDGTWTPPGVTPE